MFDYLKKPDSIVKFTVAFLWISTAFLLNVFPRVLSSYQPQHIYLVSDETAFFILAIYALISVFLLLSPKWFNKENLIKTTFFSMTASFILIIVGSFYADVAYLYGVLKAENKFLSFSTELSHYLSEERWLYASFFIVWFIDTIIFLRVYKIDIKKSLQKLMNYCLPLLTLFIVLFPLISVWILEIVNFKLFTATRALAFQYLPFNVTFLSCLFYFILCSLGLSYIYLHRENFAIKLKVLKNTNHYCILFTGITLFLKIIFLVLPYIILSGTIGGSPANLMIDNAAGIGKETFAMSPLFILLIFLGVFKKALKKSQLNENTAVSDTTGNFGTAAWATETDLKKLGAYDKHNGSLIGKDDKQKLLYLPIKNKLTIAPPEGGKTSSSSIPVLLTYNGPVFVFDIKGELWAVTARYRAEVLGRTVVALDPYRLLQLLDFAKGKPDALLKEFRINPFDWIPEDKKARDRVLNTVAASFIINEGGYSTHFDENAKILIRGYIDYMMTLDKSKRNLPELYRIMSESTEESKLTFDQMSQLDGRAAAAANQISRVGSDERGSILSTSYRQIDWMGDSNVQSLLSESNFDLDEFLKGNMDIFIVLPEDQVKEHSRLVRMMLALLMGKIVQASPSELPKQKMLFLLEELAQLGYCPDVEQCIEVLRARGVVVWTVFQTLSQIEMFKKPDLFKGAPLKQIFTNDDTKTMEWVQTLGGKKTVMTKTLSTNAGDSRQKMQTFGGTISSGEGESVHETGVDLIPLNQVRELPYDEQFVFLQGAKPIKCKKVRYFEHELFAGKFDINPLEMR